MKPEEEALASYLSTVIQSPVFQKSLEDAVEKALRKHSDLFPLPPKYLSREEVMEMLGIGSTMLNQLTQNGTIPCIKLGKKVLYDISKVKDALKPFERV